MLHQFGSFGQVQSGSFLDLVALNWLIQLEKEDSQASGEESDSEKISVAWLDLIEFNWRRGFTTLLVC